MTSFSRSAYEKDGIYAWFLSFNLFIINCIDDGLMKAFGVLLIPLSLQYDVRVWIIGSTFALMGFVGNVTGKKVRKFVIIMQTNKLKKMCFFIMHCG